MAWLAIPAHGQLSTPAGEQRVRVARTYMNSVQTTNSAPQRPRSSMLLVLPMACAVATLSSAPPSLLAAAIDDPNNGHGNSLPL